ncbi:MAG: nitrilase-related carbon-nitrogen hydrolase, partial [Myxococcota bacterium]
MKPLIVAAAALNQTPLDWSQNMDNVLAAIAEARTRGAAVLCLPEMCLTGYGCDDAFYTPGVQQTALDLLGEVASHSAGMLISLGLPLYHQKALYNTACLLVDGAIAGFVGKQFLASDGVHYEPRWFKPWPNGRRSDVEIAGQTYPIGDIFFDCGGVRLGFEICEDAWVANRPGSDLALRGVDIILNPSASHFAFDKFAVRQRFVIEGSRAFGVAYVYANLLGNEAGRLIYDGGTLIASAGALVARGPRFSFADRELTCALIDIDDNRVAQVRRGSHHPLYDDTDVGCIDIDFSFAWSSIGGSAGSVPTRSGQSPGTPGTAIPAVAAPLQRPSWEDGPHLDEEEFARSVALGLFDYLRKCRAHGFVVSLSGGAASAATAVLVALAGELAADQLGLARVRERLAHIPGVAEVSDVRSLIHTLLLCVYQATRNSTETTASAARAVAEAIGGEFMHLDIDPVVDGYVAMVAGAVGRELAWERDDIALQNIQARARGPSVWLLANLRRSLLLATSNRSEAAVGYTTMDGDTCGGLSPIAGIDKAFLRRWLR